MKNVRLERTGSFRVECDTGQVVALSVGAIRQTVAEIKLATQTAREEIVTERNLAADNR